MMPPLAITSSTGCHLLRVALLWVSLLRVALLWVSLLRIALLWVSLLWVCGHFNKVDKGVESDAKAL